MFLFFYLAFLDQTDETLKYAAHKAVQRQEYPLDAVLMQNMNELLLVYQSALYKHCVLLEYYIIVCLFVVDFGVFVTVDGNRSRNGDIDWERSPLQICMLFI